MILSVPLSAGRKRSFFIMRRSRTITLGSFGPVKPKNPFYTTCRR